MHPLLRFALIATPLSAALFLVLSGFFTAWEGRAISVRTTRAEDPVTMQVLIVADDRSYAEHTWPAAIARDLALPTDGTGVPPAKLPDQAAPTTKRRFALYFTVSPPGGEAKVVSTTSAQALSAAVLAWLLGLFLHNMWLSGSPFGVAPRALELPAPLPANAQPAGAPEGPAPKPKARPGPPPPKRRRGIGR